MRTLFIIKSEMYYYEIPYRDSYEMPYTGSNFNLPNCKYLLVFALENSEFRAARFRFRLPRFSGESSSLLTVSEINILCNIVFKSLYYYASTWHKRHDETRFISDEFGKCLRVHQRNFLLPLTPGEIIWFLFKVRCLAQLIKRRSKTYLRKASLRKYQSISQFLINIMVDVFLIVLGS